MVFHFDPHPYLENRWTAKVVQLATSVADENYRFAVKARWDFRSMCHKYQRSPLYLEVNTSDQGGEFPLSRNQSQKSMVCLQCLQRFSVMFLVMKAFKIGNLKREKKAPSAWGSDHFCCLAVLRAFQFALFVHVCHFQFSVCLGMLDGIPSRRRTCQQLKTSNERMIKFSETGAEWLASVGDCHCPRKFGGNSPKCKGPTFKWKGTHFIGHMPCHDMPRYAMPRFFARWSGAAWVRSGHLPLHGLRLWTEAFHDRSLWFSYGFPMVFLWFSYGFPMVFLWFPHSGLALIWLLRTTRMWHDSSMSMKRMISYTWSWSVWRLGKEKSKTNHKYP